MPIQDIQPLLKDNPSGDLLEHQKAYEAIDQSIKDVDTTITGIQSDLADESEIVLNTTNGYGSTGTMVRKWANVEKQSGSAMTLSQDATNGYNITINYKGVYSISYTDNFSSAQLFGISLNAGITTSFPSLAQANIIAYGFGAANNGECVSCCRVLQIGDIIRAHTQGTGADSAARSKFSITLVRRI